MWYLYALFPFGGLPAVGLITVAVTVVVAIVGRTVISTVDGIAVSAAVNAVGGASIPVADRTVRVSTRSIAVASLFDNGFLLKKWLVTDTELFFLNLFVYLVGFGSGLCIKV